MSDFPGGENYDMPLFDEALSGAERDAGISRADKAETVVQRSYLLDARKVAKQIAREKGVVTADDVVRWFAEEKHVDLWAKLGNGMGSLFRTGEWELAGYTRSTRIRSHRNLLGVWRLALDADKLPPDYKDES